MVPRTLWRPFWDGCQVNDDGDVFVSAAGMPAHMLINTNDLHLVEAVPVIDQDSAAFGQDGVVRGVPGDAESFGNPGDGEVLADDFFQRPAHPPGGKA